MKMTSEELYQALKANYNWGRKKFSAYLEEKGKTEDDVFDDQDYTDIAKEYSSSHAYPPDFDTIGGSSIDDYFIEDEENLAAYYGKFN